MQVQVNSENKPLAFKKPSTLILDGILNLSKEILVIGHGNPTNHPVSSTGLDEKLKHEFAR